MSALTVLQTPREWFKNRLTRVLVIVFHTIGIASILLILFAVYRMKDGVLREIIIWTETFYFTVSAFALLLSVVRYFGFELARHFKHRKILKILSSQTAFFLAAILISAVYMIPSVYNATTLRTVTYDIVSANTVLQADVLADGGKITVSENITRTQLDSLPKDMQIKISATAVQYNGFSEGSAAEHTEIQRALSAWNAVKNK